jgi:hypothetical protein
MGESRLRARSQPFGVLYSSLPGRLSLCDCWHVGPVLGHCRRNGGGRPLQGAGSGANASCAPCPVVTEVRGAFWSPALVESVDRWPLASPDTKIPGGSRPVVAAVRRRCPRGPVPSPEGRMPQATSARKGVIWGHCVRTGT